MDGAVGEIEICLHGLGVVLEGTGDEEVSATCGIGGCYFNGKVRQIGYAHCVESLWEIGEGFEDGWIRLRFSIFIVRCYHPI